MAFQNEPSLSQPLLPDAIEALQTTHAVKGFLPANEAAVLYEVAKEYSRLGPALEVGSYCGKSAIYLAHAVRHNQQKVYSVDHHRGSEEHQKGEGYHDPQLYDEAAKRVDTLPEMRKNLRLCHVEDDVIPVVARSEQLAQHWATPLSFIFIDGGHSQEQATADCLRWIEHLMPEGVMAIHDIFERPEEGGQAPFYALQSLLGMHPLKIVRREGSLVIVAWH